MVEPTIELIAYSFIGIVGVIGNSIVLFSIFKVARMQPVTKKFIANLAIIDLIINLVIIPCKIINVLHPDLSDNKYWIALVRCKGMPYIAEILTVALIYTLVAISVDRYVAIVHPFKKITERQYMIIMTFIWSFAFICSLPEMLFRRLSEMVSESDHFKQTKCEFIVPSNLLKMVYYGFETFENCIIPVGVVLYCYAVIWRIIKQRHIPGEGIGNDRLRQRTQRDNIKVTKIVLAITVYFVLSGIPLYIAFFVYEFYKDEQNQDLQRSIHFWLDWLAFTHLFMNPFLCCMLSTNIRNSFKSLIRCGGVGVVGKSESPSMRGGTDFQISRNPTKLRKSQQMIIFGLMSHFVATVHCIYV